MTTKINFPTWPKFYKEDISITRKILESGKVNYWTGEEGKLFEKEFAKVFDSSYAIALSNGSNALTSAYLSLDLKKGDEIITTPRTFIATASCAVLIGANPIFADVDEDSGCITAENIEPLITKKTKLISVVHLGGWPADMDSICKLAKAYNLKVVEDCSQAHGAKINKKNVGSFGDVGTWSFCQEKILSTGGEGGMVTTSNKQVMESLWSLKDHGKTINAVYKNNHSEGYRWVHEKIGTNYRMTEIQSAIGRNQLKKLPIWHEIRKRNANILINYFKNINAVRFALPKDGFEHAWYKFYVYLKNESLQSDWNRNRIISEINSMGYPAFSGSCSEIYLEKSFQKRNLFPSNRLQVAKKLGETSLMFLLHPTITEEDMHKYSKVIKEILLKAKR